MKYNRIISDIITNRAAKEIYGRPNGKYASKEINEIKSRLFLLDIKDFLTKHGVLSDFLRFASEWHGKKSNSLYDILLKKKILTVETLLLNGFLWNKTTQGYSFWSELHDEYAELLSNLHKKEIYPIE